MKRILVIIPTYNESENILNIIPEVLKFSNEDYEFNVLVVDDNSPDGTGTILEGLKEKQKNLIFLKKKII